MEYSYEDFNYSRYDDMTLKFYPADTAYSSESSQINNEL